MLDHSGWLASIWHPAEKNMYGIIDYKHIPKCVVFCVTIDNGFEMFERASQGGHHKWNNSEIFHIFPDPTKKKNCLIKRFCCSRSLTANVWKWMAADLTQPHRACLSIFNYVTWPKSLITPSFTMIYGFTVWIFDFWSILCCMSIQYRCALFLKFHAKNTHTQKNLTKAYT